MRPCSPGQVLWRNRYSISTDPDLGCSGEGPRRRKATREEAIDRKNSRILVVHHSWSGNTRSFAKLIQETMGGTLFGPDGFASRTELRPKPLR